MSYLAATAVDKQTFTGNGTWTKPRISRDWARGKAAFERTHAKLWHWDGIGEPPWIGEVNNACDSHNVACP